MAKSSNARAEQVQAAAPHGASSPADGPKPGVTETKALAIPFVWRLVFIIWGICMAIMVLYEVSANVSSLLR